MVYYTNSELYHHGILGQKWGKKNGPPYPLGSDISTGGRLKNTQTGTKKSSGGIVGYVKKKKAAKVRNKNLEKARQARAAKAAEQKRQEDFAREKDRVKESTNAKEILKYKTDYTRDELMYAYQKIEWEQKLAAVANADNKSNWDKVDRAMQRLDQTRDWIEKGVKFYNVVAKVANAALDEDLPIVGEKKGGGDQKKQKKK